MAGAGYGLTRPKERKMKITLFASNNERSFDSVSDCLAQAEKLLQQGVAIRLIPIPELTELKGFRLDGKRFLAIDEMFSFNPCFNGFMDKCPSFGSYFAPHTGVSTLVLMDSWINARTAE